MKVGIVGSGMVGATAAYALVMAGIGRDIVLVDKNRGRAEAEANDIFHAVPFAHPLLVRSGEFADLDDSDVVIIAAGVSQEEGETRLDLLGRNAAVFRHILPQIFSVAPSAVLVIATNPVDIMTHIAVQIGREFGVPENRIIGTGTTLDTARFRALLSQRLGVDAEHVHGYVLGEHGDSEVLAWSSVVIGAMPLDAFCAEKKIDLNEGVRRTIDAQVRGAAYQIIAGKGATYYGVGAAISRIVQNVLSDRRAIMTLCAPVPAQYGLGNVTLALPRLLGREGIVDHYWLKLSSDERDQLQRSAEIIHDATSALGY